MTRFEPLLCAVACSAASPVAIGQILADSAADFSGVQGQDGWYYGVWDRSLFPLCTFEPFPQHFFEAGCGGFNAWGWIGGCPPWTRIGASSVHPNAAPDHVVVRRWIAPATLDLQVNGDQVVDFFDYLDFVAALDAGC